jgi:hypothetical protein
MEENKYKFKTYIIRSRKLNYWLQFKGFVLKGTAPSRDNPKWDVFYFHNSKELRDAIDEYREYRGIQKTENP